MPWTVRKRGDEYCVYKEGTDEVEGCHETRDDALEQVRALYASEDEMAAEVNAFTEIDAFAMEIREEDGNFCVYDVTGTNLGCWGDRELAIEFIETTRNELNPTVPESEEDDGDVPEPTEDVPVEFETAVASWSGPIIFENQFTGDNRIFKPGALEWDAGQLPMPFRWQRSSVGGHDTAVPIGRVDRLERREDGTIFGEGVILLLSQEAWEYYELLRAGVAGGVSVDGDTAQFEVFENENGTEIHFDKMRIRALTAVDIPAFADAKISLIPDSVTAAAVGDLSLPMADRETRYDGLAAQKRIFDWAKTADGYDTGKLARAFLWRNSDADPNLKGSYKLPFTDVVDGRLVAVPKAIFAVAGALEGARGGVNIPDSDKAAIRSKVNTLYGKIEGDPVPPWKDDKGDGRNKSEASVEDADTIIAAAIPLKPPVEWFEDPKFKEPTPIKVLPDGRVFGHLALFGTCHIGFRECVTPPKGGSYNYFHTGELEAEQGELVAVGHMTFNTGHAALDAMPLAAANHYDHTGTVAADVRAGEDEYGIWVAGALRSTLSDEDIRTFRSAPPSGDWRRIAGKLELVGALAVNVPGFPVARSMVASGIPQTLITGPQEFEGPQLEARKRIKSRIANSLLKQNLGKRIGGK